MQTPTRREFGITMVAGATALLAEQETEACGLLRRLTGRVIAPQRKEMRQRVRPINDILGHIGETASACEHVFTNRHFVDNPTMGVVIWRWLHFHRNAFPHELKTVEHVNRAYYPAMQAVLEISDSGLHELHQEGCIEGKVAEYLDIYRMRYRECMHRQLTPLLPTFPTEKEVTARCKDLDAMHQHVPWHMLPSNRSAWWTTISPLALVGAGTLHALRNNLKILATEDPKIDAEAEKAEFGGNPREFQKWVIDRRNEHFSKVLCDDNGHDPSDNPKHLLVGENHHLLAPVRKSGAEKGQRVSVLMVGVRQT